MSEWRLYRQGPDGEPIIPKTRQARLGVIRGHGDGVFTVRLQCADGRIRLFRAGKKPTSRPPMAPAQRFEVLYRDGFRCQYCGRGAPDVKLHVDHRTAVVNGGSSDPDNLVTACADCNLGKADA